MKIGGGENRGQLMETKMYDLERQNDDLHRRNCDMSEEFLKLQTRTMKDNLLFTGIPETVDETTEVAVKTLYIIS